ncbi:MAG: HPr kinase/phosphorylase [Aestuariivirgaceae bacterium]
MQLHATCVAVAGQGVLLTGASGSGKSDLALRLIDQSGCGVGGKPMSAKLVGDDQINLTRRGSTLIASPAAALAGLLEVRGIGIIHCAHLPEAPVHLVVELSPQQSIERMPEPAAMVFEALGVSVTKIAVDAYQASASARVRAGLMAAGRLLDQRM